MGASFAAFDEMSAMENLIYSARLYGIDDEARCAAAINSSRLDPALNRPVGQLFTGHAAATSLARALLHDPRLLLWMKPFSNVGCHLRARYGAAFEQHARSRQDDLRGHAPGATLAQPRMSLFGFIQGTSQAA